TPPTVQEVGAENYKGPGLALQWVEVEGPLVDACPPASHRRLFGDLPQAPTSENPNRLEVVSKNPAADAERILGDFVRRAFLRTSMPEETLLALAAEKNLSRPDTLRGQVERLLRDPKAGAFTKHFAGQWLNLRALDATMPDPTLYPEFNDGLKESMAQEPIL